MRRPCVSGLGTAEQGQQRALAREAAEGVRTDGQRESPARHVVLVAGAAAVVVDVGAQARSKPCDAVTAADAGRPGQRDRPRHGPLTHPPAAGRRDQVQVGAGWRDPGERCEEASDGRAAELGGEAHLGQERGHLGQAAHPALGEGDLALHVRGRGRGHAQLAAPDRQVQRLVARGARQHDAQRLVQVDVGGPESDVRGAKTLGQQVEPGVHAVAGG